MRNFLLTGVLVLIPALSCAQGTLNGGLLAGGQMGTPFASQNSTIITISDFQSFGDTIRLGHGFFISDSQTLTDALVTVHNSHSQHIATLTDSMSMSDQVYPGLNTDFAAQLPVNWVNPAQPDTDCPSYDLSVTMGGSAVSGYGPYACSQAGLQAFFNDWACNANTPPSSPGNGCSPSNFSSSHYKDACWHLAVPPSCSIVETTYGKTTGDAYGVLVTGKLDPVTYQEPTKWAIVESTQPLPPNRPACSGGVAPNGFYTSISEFGGQRNPGCDGHTLTSDGKPGGSLNDVARMWSIVESGPSGKVPTTNSGILFDQDASINTLGGSSPYVDPVYGPFTWSNHVVLRDLQVSPIPGGSQGGAKGYSPAQPVRASGAVINADYSVNTTTAPTWYGADHVGLERSYIHGWDPGDPGQPSGPCGTGTQATNAQHGWTMSGQASTTDGKNFTWVNGDRIGLTFVPGATITINGSPYTLGPTGVWLTPTTVQPSISDLTFSTSSVVPGTAGTTVSFSLTNPPAQWANGCGDDTISLVAWNANNSWFGNSYLEKSHWVNSESHCISTGFATPGNILFYGLYMECGSAGWFSGGGPADQKGIANDMFIHRSVFSRNPDYRQLSAGAGHSPTLPFGCGTLSGGASLNTCPMNYSVKNTIESKMGERVAFVGVLAEHTWPDAQHGYTWLIDERSISGGGAAGVFDQLGVPLNGTDNVHIQSCWVRDSSGAWTLGLRAGSPGNGGGVSKSMGNLDFFNCVVGNLGEAASWGTGAGEIAEFAGTQQNFYCQMSRLSGVSHAACRPSPLGFDPVPGSVVNPAYPDAVFSLNSTPFSSVVSSSGVVLVSFTSRQDPVTNSPNCTGTNPATGKPGNNFGVVMPNCSVIITNAGGSISTYTLSAGGTGFVSGDVGKILTACLTFASGSCTQQGAAVFKVTSVSGGAVTGMTQQTMGSGYATGTAYILTGNSTGSGAQITPTAVVDWSGTFPIRYAYNNGTQLITNDGSLGDAFDYQPPAGSGYPSGTLCNSVATCGNLQWSIIIPTHAYQVTDIYPGNGVETQDISTFTSGAISDSTCSANGYIVGNSSSTVAYAIPPTAPNGLDVYWNQVGLPDDYPPSTHFCMLGNGSGLPFSIRVHHNTMFGTQPVGWDYAAGTSAQSISNRYHDNLFAFPTGTKPGMGVNLVGLTCTTGEGSHNSGGTAPGDLCMDPQTFAWYRSVMLGRPISNYLSVPGGSGNNSPPSPFTNWASPTPTTAGCLGSSPDPSCLGFAGYLSGNVFPITPCVPSTPFDPNNCPFTARPWSTNFDLTKVELAAGSSYVGGFNYSQFLFDMTSHQWVCPAASYCGPHGPYSEDHVGAFGQSNYTVALNDGMKMGDGGIVTGGSHH